ncbi:MAG: hypothetical protein CL912_13005 [Deltaproteobacteria bacterium]|nr:hypothetical protein [Deltaproteobacteria bacterium]|tara:strand:- start:1001 stop:1180 length:180 start_codon:yes stop_codon:yes gene_type:complete
MLAIQPLASLVFSPALRLDNSLTSWELLAYVKMVSPLRFQMEFLHVLSLFALQIFSLAI